MRASKRSLLWQAVFDRLDKKPCFKEEKISCYLPQQQKLFRTRKKAFYQEDKPSGLANSSSINTFQKYFFGTSFKQTCGIKNENNVSYSRRRQKQEFTLKKNLGENKLCFFSPKFAKLN